MGKAGIHFGFRLCLNKQKLDLTLKVVEEIFAWEKKYLRD